MGFQTHKLDIRQSKTNKQKTAESIEGKTLLISGVLQLQEDSVVLAGSAGLVSWSQIVLFVLLLHFVLWVLCKVEQEHCCKTTEYDNARCKDITELWGRIYK